MLVAVGSTRGPKVEAVRRALAALAAVHPPFAGAEIVGCDVAEVAPVMPVGTDALLEGARARAACALQRASRAALGIGLEGGLDVREVEGARRAFLVAWACVTDGRRSAHGCGGGVPLPERLAVAVLDRGIELGAAVDAFSDRHDVRSHEGAWGLLTRGVLDRSRTFEIALCNALAPFYNLEHYA